MKIKKKFMYMMPLIFGIIIGISALCLCLHILHVNYLADNYISKVELGMSPYTVLYELGNPSNINEYTYEVGQAKNFIFEYDFPYIWDYLMWSRRKIYNYLMKPNFEDVRKIGFAFEGDEAKLVEITDKSRNSTSRNVISSQNLLNRNVIPSPIPSKELTDDFFPRKAFNNEIINDIRARIWCVQGLHALGETSIYSQKVNGDSQIFRFTRVLSASYSETIRLEIQSTGVAEAFFKQAKRDKKVNFIKRTVTPEMLNTFLECIKKENFWVINSTVKDPQMISPTIWIIEGLNQDKYHIISSTEEQEGTVKQIGLQFYKLFNIDFANLLRPQKHS